MLGTTTSPSITLDVGAYKRGHVQRDPVVEALDDFDAVYREYAKFVWAILRGLGIPENTIEDAFQDVFIVAYRRRKSFEGRGTLRSWMYGITLRVARSYQRRASVRRLFSFSLFDQEDVIDTRSEESQKAEDDAELVHHLLEKVPAKQREVFVLAELEELTAKDIADIVGCNVNTVYSRLRLARQRFDEALARYRARESNGEGP